MMIHRFQLMKVNMRAQVKKDKKPERLKAKQGRQEKNNKQERTHFCWTLKLPPDGLFYGHKKNK